VYSSCICCANNYIHINLFVAFFFRGIFTLTLLTRGMEEEAVGDVSREVK
jgi:hypothetical protein